MTFFTTLFATPKKPLVWLYRCNCRIGFISKSTAIPCFWLIPMFLAFTATAAPESESKPLSPFHAHYVVTKSGLPIAKSIRSLSKLEGNRFVFESKTESIGVAKIFSDARVYERSEWQFNSDNMTVKPINYLYENATSEKKREVQLLFDWEKRTITNVINGAPWTMASTPHVKDKLLYQLQMMLDLNRSPASKELKYEVADGGKIKSYQLSIDAPEVISIDDHSYHTMKITLNHRRKTTTFWCAEELDYFPVKIVQTKKDGSTVTATLEKLEKNP